ncbi:MAG: hypothetical protein KGH55_02645 [Nanoarchaeota archaeon]|nr:hypothetical protein [Nanoarchaeota archaeon]
MKARRAGVIVAGAYLLNSLFPNLAHAQGQPESAVISQYQPQTTEQVSTQASYESGSTPQYNGVIVGDSMREVQRAPIYAEKLFGFGEDVKVGVMSIIKGANNYYKYLSENQGSKRIADNLHDLMTPESKKILQEAEIAETQQSFEFDYAKTIDFLNNAFAKGYLSSDDIKQLPNYPISFTLYQKGGHNAMTYITILPYSNQVQTSAAKAGGLEQAAQAPVVQHPAIEDLEKTHSQTGEAIGPFESSQKPVVAIDGETPDLRPGEAKGPYGVSYLTGAVNMPQKTLERKLDGLEKLQEFIAKPSRQIVDEITSEYMKAYWSNVDYANKKAKEASKPKPSLQNAERGIGFILGAKTVLPPFSPWPETDLDLGFKYGRFVLTGHLGMGPDFTLQSVNQQLTDTIFFQSTQSLKNLLTGGVSVGYLQPLTENLSALLQVGAGISSYDIYTNIKIGNVNDPANAKEITPSQSQRVYFLETDVGPVIYLGDTFGINPIVGYRMTFGNDGKIVLNQFEGGLDFSIRLDRDQKSK